MKIGSEVNYQLDGAASRVASNELAGKMQTSVPEVMNVKGEPEHVHKLYGTDTGSDTKRLYAQNCILARRLLEQGVRVVPCTPCGLMCIRDLRRDVFG